MKKIITKDGTITFFNEEYQDYYHSTSGAKEEAIEKFTKPAKIQKLAEKGDIRILDIGFGFGYNIAAAIDTAIEANKDCKIMITSFEKDIEVFKIIQELNPAFRSYNIIKNIFLNINIKKDIIKYNENNITIIIYIGDAVENIKKTDQKFNAVFHDAFAPKKNPELWTQEFFERIYQLMEKDAVLATYSCARHVRENLKNSGFLVEDGPIIGRRGPSTVAIKL